MSLFWVELCAGYGNGTDRVGLREIQNGRDQAQVTVQRFVPREFLAGIGGHAAHNGCKRAFGGLNALVDVFALPTDKWS